MTEAIPKATPPKQEFVDKYPYIVYTDHHTIVYSDTPETSIDDVSGGGGDATEYEIHSAFMTIQEDESYLIYEAEAPFVYKAVKGANTWVPDLETGAVTKAKAGEVLLCAFEVTPGQANPIPPYCITSALPETSTSEEFKYPLVSPVAIVGDTDPNTIALFTFAMPAQNAWAITVD